MEQVSTLNRLNHPATEHPWFENTACECCLNSVTPSERLWITEKVYHSDCYNGLKFNTLCHSSADDDHYIVTLDSNPKHIGSPVSNASSPSPVCSLICSPYAAPKMKATMNVQNLERNKGKLPPPRPPLPAYLRQLSPYPFPTPFDDDILESAQIAETVKPIKKSEPSPLRTFQSNMTPYPDSMNPFPPDDSSDSSQEVENGSILNGQAATNSVGDSQPTPDLERPIDRKRSTVTNHVHPNLGRPLQYSPIIATVDSTECHTFPIRHSRTRRNSASTQLSTKFQSIVIEPKKSESERRVNPKSVNTVSSDPFLVSSFSARSPGKSYLTHRSSSIGIPVRVRNAARSPNLDTKSMVLKREAPPLPIPNKRTIKADPSEQSVDYSQLHTRLCSINKSLSELERSSRKLQTCIKEASKSRSDVTHLLDQWSSLAEMKDSLFKEESELLQRLRRQELEERHANLEHELRVLLSKQDCLKTNEEKTLEKELIGELIHTVDRRSELLQEMEQLNRGATPVTPMSKAKKFRKFVCIHKLPRRKKTKEATSSRGKSPQFRSISNPTFCIRKPNTNE